MKIKYFIILILTITTSFSCSKWLNVTPEDVVTQEALFSKGIGFRNALNGVYNDLSDQSLYGQEMMFATTDVLGQCYIIGDNGIPSSSKYARFAEYDYTSAETEAVIEKIWNNTYNSIANCNNIIANIDNLDASKFYDGAIEKDLIKGEAFALRGFLHFEMLRYFAPAPIKNDSKKWIPYFTKFPSTFEPNISLDDALDLVIEDLQRAKELVSRYDTLDNKTLSALHGEMRFSNTSSDDLFFSCRGFRMNNLAICAILARAYNYKGDHKSAKEYANYVINFSTPSGKALSFTNFYQAKGNRKMTHGLIFSLSNVDLYDYYGSKFNGTFKSHDKLVLKFDYSTLFDDGNDYRKKELLYSLNTKDYRSTRNVMPFSPSSTSMNYVDILPIIRLSELYYILAESEADEAVNNGGDFRVAVRALDAVRRGRDCSGGRLKIKNMEEFREELIKEVKREFYSEGQIFHYYKKLDIDLIDNMKDDSYYFPKTKSENIF